VLGLVELNRRDAAAAALAAALLVLDNFTCCNSIDLSGLIELFERELLLLPVPRLIFYEAWTAELDCCEFF
jgi:hypothetical protein